MVYFVVHVAAVTKQLLRSYIKPEVFQQMSTKAGLVRVHNQSIGLVLLS